MPMYDFKCSECEHVQEELEPSTKESKKKFYKTLLCEKCSSNKLKRLFSVPTGFSVVENVDTSIAEGYMRDADKLGLN